MGKGFTKVLAVLGVIGFWFWTGLGAIGNVQAADYLAQHHDIIGLLAKTPPAYPGVAGLALAGVLCYLLLSEPKLQQPRAVPELPKTTLPAPMEPRAVTKKEVPKPVPVVPPTTTSDERIFVNLTIAQLTQPFRDHTNLQAQRLFAAYKNKWLRLSGSVDEISHFSEKEINVVLAAEQPSPNLAMLYFGSKWREHLDVLTKGARIEVIGRIERASGNSVGLDECEIVD